MRIIDVLHPACLRCLGNRQAKFDPSALTQGGNDSNMAPQLPHSLLHPHPAQALAANRGGVESTAIIHDGAGHPSSCSLQGHAHLVRSRMLGDVCEGFLNHPVETGPVSLGQKIETHRTCLYRVVQEALTNVTKHAGARSEEHTSELQSPDHLVCRLLLE